MKLFISIVLSILCLMSCKSSSSPQSLEGKWIIDKAMDVTAQGGDQVAFIQFASDGTLSGCSSVNRFNASYTLQKDSLKISPVAMTRRMGRSMHIETAVAQALDAASRIKVKGQQAYILNEKNETVMVMLRE